MNGLGLDFQEPGVHGPDTQVGPATIGSRSSEGQAPDFSTLVFVIQQLGLGHQRFGASSYYSRASVSEHAGVPVSEFKFDFGWNPQGMRRDEMGWVMMKLQWY